MCQISIWALWNSAKLVFGFCKIVAKIIFELCKIGAKIAFGFYEIVSN